MGFEAQASGGVPVSASRAAICYMAGKRAYPGDAQLGVQGSMMWSLKDRRLPDDSITTRKEGLDG